MTTYNMRALRELPVQEVIGRPKGHKRNGVQFTLDGKKLSTIPQPLLEEYWVEAYAKALLSGEMQVKFDPELSAALAEAMQWWAEKMLESDYADVAESVQSKLKQAAKEENIDFGYMSDYYIAKVTADRMKDQQTNADACDSLMDVSQNGSNDSLFEPPNDDDNTDVQQDGSSTDSFFEPPHGDGDTDKQQDLDEGANMGRYHYVNIHQDRENDVGVSLQTPGSSTEARDKCIDSCKSESGKLLLMQGAPKFVTQSGSSGNLTHLEPCPSHKFKRWVIASITPTIDTEEGFKELVAREGFENCPLFVGCCGVDYAREMVIMYQSSESDKHKVKKLSIEGARLQTFKKGGGQSQKVIETIVALRNQCTTFLTNLEVRNAETASGDDISYEQALDIVADWGVDKLTAFIENTKLKKARDQTISGLEGVCLVCKASLMEEVKLRQDASEFVFYLHSERQSRDCPMRFDDGATDYAKNLKIYVWSPSDKQFEIMTLRDWLEEGHLDTALLLMGEGGKGKSKLSHMLAQELTRGYAKELYMLTKAIDPLGILSHTGVFKKAGALIIADADFKTTKGQGSFNTFF